jgi:hypothetical protein
MVEPWDARRVIFEGWDVIAENPSPLDYLQRFGYCR